MTRSSEFAAGEVNVGKPDGVTGGIRMLSSEVMIAQFIEDCIETGLGLFIRVFDLVFGAAVRPTEPLSLFRGDFDAAVLIVTLS